MSFIENIQKSGREINIRISWQSENEFDHEGLEQFSHIELNSFTHLELENLEGTIKMGSSVYKIDRQFEADFFRTSMTQIDGEIKGRYDLTGKVLKIELGVSFDGSGYDYINFGDFVVKEHERIVGNNPLFDRTKFKAFDKMILFHKPYDVVELGITYPISVFNLLSALATNVGLVLDATTIVNGSMMIEEDKWTNIENVTLRNILDEIAQVSGSTILISNNKLKAKYTGLPVIALFEQNLRTLKMEEEYGPVNILNLARMPQRDNYVFPLDWNTIPVEDRTEVVFTNNQILDKRRDEYAPAIFNQIEGLQFFPFEADTTGLAFIEPLDAIEVTDMNNITHLSYVMHSRLKVSSGIREMLKAVVPIYAEREFALVTDQQREQSRTELLVDKQNETITQVVEVVEELEGQVETNTSEIQQTKDFFSLTFTRNLHELKNKLVYGNTIHMFGAEVGENVGFTEINVAVPEVYFMSTNQGTNTYYFMPINEISLYNLKLGQPYTFSATLISDIVPSTAQPANDVGVSVYYYVSGSSIPILLTAKNFKALDEELSNFITFTLPTNAVGWNMKMEVEWSLQGTYTFMHFLMKNAQLEEGSSVTAFSNSASTISGARYVFNGDSASFFNGGLRIFNKDDVQVFGADTNGNLRITGQITANTGSIGRFSITDEDLLYTSDLFNYEYDQSDIIRLQRILAGIISSNAYYNYIYDTNSSGTLTTTDLIQIQNYVVSGTALPTPRKRVRSVIRIGTDNGEFSTTSIAEDNSVGSQTKIRGDRFETNSIKLDGETIIGGIIESGQSLSSFFTGVTSGNPITYYTMFNDGTLEYHGTVDLTFAITTNRGSGAYFSSSANATLTIPSTLPQFIDRFEFNISTFNSSRFFTWNYHEIFNSATCLFGLNATNSISSRVFDCSWTARGRWKT